MLNAVKEKLLGLTGSISGLASVMGSWQVCHNICLILIAALSIIGVSLTGMPLAFLTELSVPFWTIAFALLIVTVFLYVKKKCISRELLLFNGGLITAGIPFRDLETFIPLFWAIGGALALSGIILFLKKRIEKS
jgi:hypothetical protein